MSNPTKPYICAITPDDLRVIKPALEIILGNNIKSSHRLEIFARLAGYRTFAALKTDIDGKIDIFGDPLQTLIYENPRINDPFISELSIDVRRHLAALEGTGIIRMVGAALQLAYDPVFGDIGIVPEDLDDIIKVANEANHFSSNARNNYLLPEGRLVLISSPANLDKLREGTANLNKQNQGIATDDNCWTCAPVTLGTGARFFDDPTPNDMIDMDLSDQKSLAKIAQDSTLIFFSKEDQEAFIKTVEAKTGRTIDPRMMIAIMPGLLDMEDEEEGDFFSIGYYGTARNETPESYHEVTGAFSVSWLAELTNIVHGCAYEFERLVVGTAA